MDAIAVEYFDERKGFWRLGYLEKTDRTWAWVRTVIGRKLRIPVTQTREVEAKKARTPLASTQNTHHSELGARSQKLLTGSGTN